jgi:hypothetical protein
MRDLRINNDVTMTLKELEEGQLYITRTSYKKVTRGRTRPEWEIRRRTKDPFRSKTLLGANIRSFPSEKVFTVEEI